MKRYLLILMLSTPLVGFSQTLLDTVFGKDMCDCVNQAKGFSGNVFEGCILNAMQKDSALIMQEALLKYHDTSEETGHKIGLDLISRMSVSLVYTCDTYFHYIDTVRYSYLRNSNTDSLQKEIGLMGKTGEISRDKKFYFKRGILYFQTASYPNAVSDFDSALRLDSTDVKSAVLKGMAFERMNDLNAASDIYIRLSSKNEYYKIIVAIVERKKMQRQ